MASDSHHTNFVVVTPRRGIANEFAQVQAAQPREHPAESIGETRSIERSRDHDVVKLRKR